MDAKTITETLVSLCEGRMDAQEWRLWFAEYGRDVEQTCGRRYFLKIKPAASRSDTENAYYGQRAAAEWLKTQNTDCPLSDVYRKAWEQEFDDFRRALDGERQELQKAFATEYAALKGVYPKLFRQLGRSFSRDTKIGAGKSTAEIQAKEHALSVRFSDELKTFFSHIGAFEFEGVRLDFEDLDKQLFGSAEYLVLGEFWHHADGDKLLYSAETGAVSLFAHGYSPPKIIPAAASMTGFVETGLVNHLKKYEN